jgi:hypothetical protein
MPEGSNLAGITRDRSAHVRLYRLAAEILAAVEAGVFPPHVGWHWQDRRSGAAARRRGERSRSDVKTDPVFAHQREWSTAISASYFSAAEPGTVPLG